jgi:hypothetical protein
MFYRQEADKPIGREVTEILFTESGSRSKQTPTQQKT